MRNLSKLSNLNVFYTLLIIGLCVYFRILFNGFVGDDAQQIYNYGLVTSIPDLPKVFFYHHVVLDSENSILSGYYKPLMLLFFYSVRAIFGTHPFFYHAPQLIFAICNSFFVFFLFKKFLKRETSILLAIIFLIHPINQETVAYVSDIQDILFFFFGILAFLLVSSLPSPKRLLTIGILLLCSLLSKETGVLFYIITLIYVALYFYTSLKKYISVFIFVPILYLGFRLLSQGTSVFWIEPSPMSSVSFLERLKHAPILFFYYVKTAFFPFQLVFNQQWIIKNIAPVYLAAHIFIDVILISILSLITYAFYIKKSKYFKTFLFFSVWFILGLLPHLQLLPLDATVADRWFYFSAVGLLGILGVSLEIILLKLPKHEKLIFISIVIICLLLSLKTFTRNVEWSDAFSLYSKDAALSKSALIENNLGDEYFKMGDFKNAKKHFKNAIHINPDLWIALNNLGIIEEKNGDLKKALSYYKLAFSKGERLPIDENIARAYVLDKNYDDAITFSKRAIKKYPLSSKLPLTLSLAYYEKKDYESALPWAKKSYDLEPNLQTLQVIEAIEKEIQN